MPRAMSNDIPPPPGVTLDPDEDSSPSANFTPPPGAVIEANPLDEPESSFRPPAGAVEANPLDEGIDPSQVIWDDSADSPYSAPLTLSRGAKLFGSGIAKGAGAMEETGARLVRGAAGLYQKYIDPYSVVAPLTGELAGAVENEVGKGIAKLPTPQGTAETGVYNAGEGVGRVLPFAVAPETLPGALLSSEVGEGARTAVGAAGGSSTAQNVADIAGGLATSVPTLASAAVRGLARGASGLATQQSINDFESMGMPVSAGTVTGNRALLGIERTVAAMPGGAGRMERLYADQGKGASGMVDGIIDNLTGGTLATPTAGGEAVEQGVKNTIGTVRSNAKSAYAAVDQIVPHDTPIDVSGTSQLLKQLTTPAQGAEATTGSLIAPKIKALADNLQTDTAATGRIPYAAARQLKTSIGDQIDWSPFPTDPANGALKRIYGQLGADIDQGASSLGPNAAQTVRAANAQYAANMDRLEGLQRIVGKNGGPEAVFNAALSGSGPKGGATVVSRVMDALDPQQKNIFAASVLRRMATPSPGSPTTEFSPSQFLTQWNKMNPEAREATFGGLPNGYKQSLDTLTRNLSRLKVGNSVLMNPSGTAAKLGHTAFLADMIGSVPVMFAQPHAGFAMAGFGTAAWAGANVAARVLTNPNAVRWLSQATAVPSGRLLGSAAAAFSAPRSASSSQQDQISTFRPTQSQWRPPAASSQERALLPSPKPSPDRTPSGERTATSRASGGKVDHEALVSRLMGRWHAARKAANETTKPLLNESDATIAKALSIARGALP